MPPGPQAHTWNIWRTFLRGRLTFSLCISWWISSMLSSPSPFLSASSKVCFTQLPACQGQAHRGSPHGEGRQDSSGKNPFCPCPHYSSVKCCKPELVYGDYSQLSSQHQSLCTSHFDAPLVPPLGMCPKAFRYCWALLWDLLPPIPSLYLNFTSQPAPFTPSLHKHPAAPPAKLLQ